MNKRATGDKINTMRKLWWIILFTGILSVELSLFLPYLDSFFISEDFFQLAFARFTEDPFMVLYSRYYGTQFWRPLFQLLNALAWHVLETNATGYHVLTLSFHCFNTFLLGSLFYLVSSGLDIKPGWRFIAAAFAALYFGLHPIASLTTIWFTCFEDLHGMFFMLLTLMLILSQWRGFSLLAFLTSMLAFLSKETLLMLPLLAMVAGYIKASQGNSSFRQGIISAIRWAAPVIAAFSCYLAWRVSVTGGIGGYEELSLSPSFIIPRISYHVPRVLKCVPGDILFHHLNFHDHLFNALAFSYLFILAISIIPSIRRSPDMLVALCLFTLVTIAPLWSSSHMLHFREERLLYQPLLGASLILGTLIISPGRNLLKLLMLIAAALVIYLLASMSTQALRDWQEQSERNRSIMQAVRAKTNQVPENSPPLRFYIAGLTREDYALDPMIKIHLDEDKLSHSFMLAEHESWVWRPGSQEVRERETLEKPADKKKDVPQEALPEEKGFFLNPRKYLVSFQPPDLLSAANLDPNARVYEWRDSTLVDLENQLRKLSFRRGHLQNRYRYPEEPRDLALGKRTPYHYLYLPSFSFHLQILVSRWGFSPGLSCQPDQPPGQPRGFTARTNDPYLVSPGLSFPALAAAAVEFEMKVEPREYVPPQEQDGALFWIGSDEEGFGSSNMINFEVKADGEFHRYLFDLNRSFAWSRSDMIKRIRIDPISYPGMFWIKRIEFLPGNFDEFRGQDTESGPR